MFWLGNCSLKNFPRDPQTTPTPAVILVHRFSLENPSPNYRTFQTLFSTHQREAYFHSWKNSNKNTRRLPYPDKDNPCKNKAYLSAIFPRWAVISEMPFLIQKLSRHLTLIQKLCHFGKVHYFTSWTFHSFVPTSFDQYLRYFLVMPISCLFAISNGTPVCMFPKILWKVGSDP